LHKSILTGGAQFECAIDGERINMHHDVYGGVMV
jgi:hypothetical protein